MHCQLDRVGTAEQDFGDGIFRGALGAGVAAHTDALFAAARPKPGLFGGGHFAGTVQQFETDGGFRRAD